MQKSIVQEVLTVLVIALVIVGLVPQVPALATTWWLGVRVLWSLFGLWLGVY